MRILLIAGIAGAVFLATTAMAMGRPPDWEIRTFEAVHGLPDWLFVFVWPFMQYGVFVTIPIVGAIALAFRRRRLSVLLLATGVTIYLAAKVAKRVADRGRPGAFLTDVASREHFAPGSLGFPSGHAAVAGAIAAITYYWLPRSLQRVTLALVAIVVFGRMYVGAHLPLDLIGGVAMGVAAGSLATFAFGGPTPSAQRRSGRGQGRGSPPEGTPGRGARSTLGVEGDEKVTVVTRHPRAQSSAPGVARGGRRAGRAGSAPLSRHAGDVARVVAGLGVLAMSLLAVRRAQLSAFERDLFLLVNNLPGIFNPLLVAIMQAGNVVAAPAVAAAALVARRRRMALDSVVAGTLAWFAAKGVKSLIERPRPVGFLEDLTRMGPGGLGFVSGHTAVAAAIATAVSPYLPRRVRHLVWGVVWVVGFARVYVGAHLPLDIVGGAALGWVIGSTIHLLLGAPSRVPGPDDARRALVGAGWAVTEVHRVGQAPAGSFPFIAVGPAGERFVKLLDPESRNRDWIFRIPRFLVFRDVRDEVVMADARYQGEHEVAMGLLARQAGVRVPTILAIEHQGRQTWLVQEVAGRMSLGELDDVDESLLVDVWSEVATLHDAGLAHRDLVAGNIVVDDTGRPSLVDFAHAVSSASTADQDNDVAELLASTAVLVGPEVAVRAATTVIGEDRVRRAVSDLQPLALTAVTRRAVRHVPGLLPMLRRLAAPHATAASDRAARSLGLQARCLAAGVGATTALLLVAGLSDVGTRFGPERWRWYGVMGLAALALWVQGAALVVFTAGRRLALGRTMAIVAESAVGAVVAGQSPGRHLAEGLRRSGLNGSDASATAERTVAVRSAMALVGLVATLSWAIAQGTAPSLPLPWSPVPVVAVGIASLLLVWWPHRRHWSVHLPRMAPDRWAALSLMALGELVVWVLVLVAAEQSVGGDAALAAVAMAAVVGWSVGLALQGGPGVVDATLVLVLGASGVALPTAVAAVLSARVVTYWLPAVATPTFYAPLRRRWTL